MQSGVRLLLTALLLGGSACATSPGPSVAEKPPEVDVTGTWTGVYQGRWDLGSGRLELQQQGANVTGHASFQDYHQVLRSGVVYGSVRGNVLILAQPESIDLTVTADRMVGTVRLTGGTVGQFELSRRP
jgi:hypothetical protein